MTHYNMTLGKLYKWLLLAIKTRKEDIVRRKGKEKKAREERERQILLKESRQVKREQDVIEAEEKFKEEHKEEIEAALKGEELKKYDDEGNEIEDGESKPVVMPVFRKEEFLAKFDEEHP